MFKLPSMPFYVDDYESHTAHLTLEEDGIYNRLLRLCWRSPDCMVPDDDRWLIRHLRIDADTFERVGKVVINDFFKRKDGRIYQKRQRQEFLHVTSLVKKRRESGAKGGRAKAMKSKDIDVSNASDLPEANDWQNESNTLPPTTTATTTTTIIKEEEGAQAREVEFFEKLKAAVGVDLASEPSRFWRAEAVEPWVTRWRKVGLTDDQILAEAKASRVKNPEPPEGPKALNAWMMQAATNHTAASSPLPEGAKAQAKLKLSNSPQERLQQMADRINGPDHVPPSMVTNTMRDALLEAGLVTRERLRERQIY